MQFYIALLYMYNVKLNTVYRTEHQFIFPFLCEYIYIKNRMIVQYVSPVMCHTLSLIAISKHHFLYCLLHVYVYDNNCVNILYMILYIPLSSSNILKLFT